MYMGNELKLMVYIHACSQQMAVGDYRIAGNFGEVFYSAIWHSMVNACAPISMVPSTQITELKISPIVESILCSPKLLAT